MGRPTSRRPKGSSGTSRGAGPTRPPGRRAGGRATGRPRAGATPSSRRRRLSLTPRRWVALASVLFLLAVMLVPTAKSYLDQRSRIGELRAEVAQQEQDVKTLERERELWATDEYVEAQARQRLKFVKVGDRAYTVIDADPEADVDPETGAATGDLTGPWYERLGDSLAAADARTGTAR